MEHGHVSPNLDSENSRVEVSQDEGGVDTNIAGPSESKKSFLSKLETNQSNETTKLKNNNDNVEALDFESSNIIQTITQDNESEKNHYICKFCSKVFDKHQALGGHMNGHSKDQRNLEKFGKVTTWIQETFPTPQNTTLISEAVLQGIPTNGASYNYNHPIEIDDVLSKLGGQWTNQQLAQQIQLSQGLQTQQRQQFQNYQAQEPQSYQPSEGLQSNQSPQRPQSNRFLQGSPNSQAPQGFQNYQASQGLQNYQTPQVHQNYQASQGSQSYQALQQFQNYQIPQGPQYYEASQGFQSHQAPQGFEYYQASQGPQYHQAAQGSQCYRAPQGSQSYQAPQGSQNHQAPQGSRHQLVVDANNQQKINLNAKTSIKTTSLAKVPSNEQMSISTYTQGPHFQEKAQSSQRYMPNPHNLRNGDRLTTGPFINEQMNKEYYTQLGPNVLERNNQMINIPHSYGTGAQYGPANSPNTFGSFNESNVDSKTTEQ